MARRAVARQPLGGHSRTLAQTVFLLPEGNTRNTRVGLNGGVEEVLMDLVVMLAGTVDELAGLEDEYERELTNVLESVVAELEKLNADDRRAFAAHVGAMSARAAADPFVSAHYRDFLAEFPTSFGLVEDSL